MITQSETIQAKQWNYLGYYLRREDIPTTNHNEEKVHGMQNEEIARQTLNELGNEGEGRQQKGWSGT